jgi:hypothetical protein
MKSIRKRLSGALMVIMVISSLLVSCGQKDKLPVEKETGFITDDSEVDMTEDAEADNLNLLNAEEKNEQVPSQEPPGGSEVANGVYLVNTEEPIRDGEELAIIQAQYEQDKAADNQGELFGNPEYLLEIDIPDLYKKTQMKAYHAFTISDTLAGTYLLYNKIALRVFDTFQETCIADIDQNGEYELLSLFSFGSGIYRINLNVYQATNPITFSSTTKIPMLQYHNCFIPKAGYANLMFDQVSDSEVHLKELDLESEQVGKDYGKLVIDQETGQITLDNLDGFPYNLWDNVYNQENWYTQEYDYESLIAIPELQVSVGDTVITNVSWKKEWNGEKEEVIAFSDAITEEIPQFSPPSETFKFEQEIRFEFPEVKPSSIQVMDTLITKEGQQIYTDREILERALRRGEDGAYYLGLENHFALLLSSNTASYTNPSYRGFRIICEFGYYHSCEYVFVLSLAPIWNNE